MYIMKFILLSFVLCIVLLSCQDNTDMKKIDNVNIVDSLLNAPLPNVPDSLTDTYEDNLAFHSKNNLFYLFYANKYHKPILVDCSLPLDPTTILNTDILLSHLKCPLSRTKQTVLLRQLLIASKYKYSRTLDSLSHINNNDLLKMLSIVYNQDIPSDILEGDNAQFTSCVKHIQTLLEKKKSYDKILKYIHDSVFNYVWMNFTIQTIAPGILQLDYNGGGMAGSAEKRYFLQSPDSLKLIDMDKIADKINALMSKELAEPATVNMDRFPIKFKKDPESNLIEMQIIIDTYSSASCCPLYIARCKTKDFRTILPGTLAYATTDHLDDPSIKPKWKTIR